METVPVECLQPAPYNPRKPLKPGMKGYDRLKRSLAEFALVQPIVWNKTTGHVVSGHQRLAILLEDQIETLDVLVVELSLAREKALNIALNNHAVGSDWDADTLIETLVELDELPEFDLELTGFDEEDLKRFVLTPDPSFEPDASDEQESSVYRVTFEIPPDQWEALRPDLDELLSNHTLHPHIQTPGNPKSQIQNQKF
jgi:hypothetical protein